jgi:putative exporter of polyketide antibiotics
MNFNAVKAIYRTEMARMMRTIVQSIVAPVLSTSLYFVIFGSAIGSLLSFLRHDGAIRQAASHPRSRPDAGRI